MQTCPDNFTTQEPTVPELCAWLMSFDVIALATVESRTVPRSYAIESDLIRRVRQPVKDLGLAAQFPWLDAASASADDIVVVDSCPVGLSASDDNWRLDISELPSLVVNVHIDMVLSGAISDASTRFYVGWEQRLRWRGPKASGEGEWMGTQLAPGSAIGVPLTYDRSEKNLLLAGEQPFVVDDDGQVRMNSITCPPLVPKTFNGTTLADLAEQIDECSKDNSAVLAGAEVRDARVNAVSAPFRFPATASYCLLSYEARQ